MSYHIIDISTNNVVLSVKDGQLVCRNPDESTRKLPMEDIGAILVNCFSAHFHSSFLIEAARNKVAVVICEKFKPVSLVLPVQRSSDTILTRAQIQTPIDCLYAMWRMTIDAKCANQHELASRVCAGYASQLAKFKRTMDLDSVSKESNCARLYWRMFSRSLGVKGFKREQHGDGLNGLLDYGYAVLMVRIVQRLLCYGLDPMYGMGHKPRERSLPLAYDIMEPFRPVVDELAYHWIADGASEYNDIKVDRPYKELIHGMMDIRCSYRGTRCIALGNIIDLTIRSYREALISGNVGIYKPWIRRNLKWDG